MRCTFAKFLASFSVSKNFRSRFPLRLIRAGTFTHQGEVSGPVWVGFRLNRFGIVPRLLPYIALNTSKFGVSSVSMRIFLPRKTEFTGAGLLTSDQKVGGSNPSRH